jgi:hypothetical protein
MRARDEALDDELGIIRRQADLMRAVSSQRPVRHGHLIHETAPQVAIGESSAIGDTPIASSL